jgi:parvulin-like peptidyl-prolyl isomerase
LIDQQLLLQRAEDLGKTAEAETVKRLDEIRRNMNLPVEGDDGMDALRRAVEAQGKDYEDFKQSIRNSILTQKVIEEDVAPRIEITPEEMQAYYNAHRKEFVRDEEVGLSEILIPTKGKPEADLPKLKKLADEIQARATKGENFAKLAQRYSAGQTASDGGYIGFFKKGSLSPELEKVVFKLSEGEVTPVLNTDNGYLILKVDTVHHAGQQSFAEARQEIEYRLYQQKLQPELRHYLARLRGEAYIIVKPGYSDTGSSENASVNIERFERVLPQDLPKPVEKKKSGGLQ